MLRQVPSIGDYIVRGLGIILLFMGFLLLYDLAKTTYNVVRAELDKVLDMVAMRIEKAEHGKDALPKGEKPQDCREA
ncbi:MAG: hypothetical protein DRN96_04475 [Thermoproteota archaeon]|nr:MAG: hypothetical protein DRN96_04475 [Candidatus Korarchaeota archaeon]